MLGNRLGRPIVRLLQLSRTFTGNQQQSSRFNPKWLAAAMLSSAYIFSQDDDVLKVKAGNLSEYVDGRFKKVQIGSDSQNYIVVTKHGDQVYAIGGKCSHWGVPLEAGYSDGFTAYCPAHLAGFDLRTGEAVVGPGIEKIPNFRTEVLQNGDVVVQVPKSYADKVNQREESKLLKKPDGSDDRTFVIIGGGAAGQSCAETLRKNGFNGKIVILTSESLLPYERPLLSKNLKGSADTFLLKSADFYSLYEIDVRLNSKVTSVDVQSKQVQLENGQKLSYDKLCIATGTKARVPMVYKDAVETIENVFTIRNAEDHTRLRQQVELSQNVVIIGGSFLGAETATAVKKGFPDKNVTIIDIEEHPLKAALGLEVSQALIGLQRDNGVRVIAGAGAKSINAENGKVSSVTVGLKDPVRGNVEEIIPAETVLVATGAQVVTDFLPQSLLSDDGSVRVNRNMRTNSSDIYAAGDIAKFFSTATESLQRIEHWAVALDQGAVAAKNMLGKGVEYSQTPFFWTNQFGNAQFIGYGQGADFTWTESGPAGNSTYYLTYFFKGNECIGVAGYNKFGSGPVLRVALNRGLMPTREEIVNMKYDDIAKRVMESTTGCGKKKCCRKGN